MNRAKLIRFSVRLANSLSSTRQPGLHWVRFNQVIHFSNLSQSSLFYLFKCQPSHYNFPNFHQKLHFCSKTESFIELILSPNDWSEKLENELEKLNPKITHESIVYILMRLNKNPQKCLHFFSYVCDRKAFQPSFVPYSLLLRSLACWGYTEEFWAVANVMKEKGFCFDDQIHGAINESFRQENLVDMAARWNEFYKLVRLGNGENDVFKAVVEVILRSDWSNQVESVLVEKLRFPLNDDFLFKVIWKLRKEPVKALKFFKWVESSLKYEHNSITYSVMARVLAWGRNRGSIDEFWDLLMQMRSQGYEIDHDSYVKITRCIANGDAVKLFEFMMDSPYKVSDQQCAWLLKQLSDDLDPDINLVNRVVKKYLEAGNIYTKAIYSGIHRSLCKVGRFDEAKKFVDDMRNAGYELDNILYSQEVSGLCKQRRFKDAYLVLDRMEAEGCVPDIKTWTILIQGYCETGQMDQALTCFAQVLEKKLELDAEIVDVLIKGFLSQNNVLGAYNFLVDMVNKFHLKPWQATYRLLIEKMIFQGGKLEEAFNLVGMMKLQKYPPYPEPLVAYISRFGTVEDAKRLLTSLSWKGSASTAAYVKVISAFYERGRHSEAKDLLYSSPHAVRYNKEILKLFGFSSR